MGQKEQEELDLYTNRRFYTGVGLILVGVSGWAGIYYAIEAVRGWLP